MNLHNIELLLPCRFLLGYCQSKRPYIYENMVDILEEYKKYVPSKPVTLKEAIPGIGTTEGSNYSTIHSWLFVCCTCPRCSVYSRKYRFGKASFLPTSEGWHADVCFLEVCSTLKLLSPPPPAIQPHPFLFSDDWACKKNPPFTVFRFTPELGRWVDRRGPDNQGSTVLYLTCMNI